MHIFHLNSLFIKFLYMFVLPDVASSYVAGVELVHIVFCITDFSCELTETMKMIFSYKFYFAFFMT